MLIKSMYECMRSCAPAVLAFGRERWPAGRRRRCRCDNNFVVAILVCADGKLSCCGLLVPLVQLVAAVVVAASCAALGRMGTPDALMRTRVLGNMVHDLHAVHVSE